MLMKTVKVGDQEVTFKSTAAIPRLYRIEFGRDIFRDMDRLRQTVSENAGKTGSSMAIEDLELFENVAYIMAKHADPSIPNSIDEWLEQFEMFSIYEILPEILELWGKNFFTQVEPKKNEGAPSGK